MIMLTLKPRASRFRTRSRFHVSAIAARPTRSSPSKSPTSTPSPASAAADATYLRRWVAHQATTYNDLLKTIAAAPAALGERD